MLLLGYDPTITAQHTVSPVAYTTKGYADAGGRIDQLSDEFEAQGLRVLGTGAYGIAVLLHDGSVMKISCSADDPWPEYIEYVQESQARRPELYEYMPKVYSTRRLPTGHFVAIMERLYPQCDCALPDWVRAAVMAATPPHVRWDLHERNVMMREDGDPVITDPWSHKPWRFW